jgi:hypothetical protein
MMRFAFFIAASAAAARSAADTMTGQLTDFDGYATNAALAVAINQNGTASEWSWVGAFVFWQSQG